MNFLPWFARKTQRPVRRDRSAVPGAFLPQVEALEERVVPTTYTVTNLNGNTSSGSLRGTIMPPRPVTRSTSIRP